jgi:hypothetical protein
MSLAQASATMPSLSPADHAIAELKAITGERGRGRVWRKMSGVCRFEPGSVGGKVGDAERLFGAGPDWEITL